MRVFRLDALGDQPHAVPDHEDTRRHRHALTGVEKDAIAGGYQRFHGVAIDGDHPQVGGPRTEFVADHALGEHPRPAPFLEVVVQRAGARRRAHVDLRHADVAGDRHAFALLRRYGRWDHAGLGSAPAVLLRAQVVRRHTEMQRQRLAHVLGQHLGCRASDVLVKIRIVLVDRARGHFQVRAGLLDQLHDKKPGGIELQGGVTP